GSRRGRPSLPRPGCPLRRLRRSCPRAARRRGDGRAERRSRSGGRRPRRARATPCRSAAGRRLGLLRGGRLGRRPRQLLDPPVGGVELAEAEAVELLAALPERDRLVQSRLAALEPLDDALELPLGGLERQPGLVGHSTRAPNSPSATSTRIGCPGTTAAGERTISPPLPPTSPSVRTIAYPLVSVAFGDNERSRPALCSSPARFRSTASDGARRSRSWTSARR